MKRYTLLTLLTLFLLLFSSCFLSNNTKIDKISITCPEEKTILNSQKKYYYNYSTPGAIISLTALCYDDRNNIIDSPSIIWKITDPYGNIYSPLEYKNSLGNKTFTINGDKNKTLGVIISSLDSLGSWTATASCLGISAEYSFIVDSQNDIQSSLCIDYSSIDLQSGKIKRNTQNLSNLPSSINLCKGKFYYIGFYSDNNLGKLFWECENTDNIELYDQNLNPLSFPLSTPASIKGVYVYAKNLSQDSQLKIKAGNLYEKDIAISIAEQSINNTITPPEISYQAIEGGYLALISVGEEITNQTHTLYYRTSPSDEYIPALIDNGTFTTEIKTPGHYSFNAYLSSNTSDEKSSESGEKELDITYPPIIESLNISSLDILHNAPTTSSWYDQKEIKNISISITSLPQTNVYDNAEIIFIDSNNQETILTKDDIPYTHNISLTSSGLYNYYFYYNNLKGYANLPYSSLNKNNLHISNFQIEIPNGDIDINYEYESNGEGANENKSKYTISVKENTPSYPWTLYYQYSQDYGATWSKAIAVNKADVLNKKFIIKDEDASDLFLPTSSPSCILRSKIVSAGYEDVFSKEASLDRLLSATPCSVNTTDEIQRYYNAREVKWTKAKSTDKIYYQIPSSSSQYYNNDSWIESKSTSGNTGYIRIADSSTLSTSSNISVWIKTVDEDGNNSIKKYATKFEKLSVPNLKISGDYGVFGACRDISVDGYSDIDKLNNPIVVFSGRCDVGDGDEVRSGVSSIRSSSGSGNYLAYCNLSESNKQLLYDGMVWAAGDGYIKGFARSKGYIDSDFSTGGKVNDCTVDWSTIHKIISDKLE